MENYLVEDTNVCNDLYNVASAAYTTLKATPVPPTSYYGVQNNNGTVTWATKPNTVSTTISTNALSSTELRDKIEKKIKEETEKIEDLERTALLSEDESSVTYLTILQYHLGAKATLLELLEEVFQE